MKKSKFKKIRLKCLDRSICDCGNSEICSNDDNPDEICEKEYCPKLKEQCAPPDV